MNKKTFRCAGEDEHFVSVYPDDNSTLVIVEDYYRGRSVVDRVKTALRILLYGVSDFSEIILNKQEVIALGIYLFECANKMEPQSKVGQVVHDVPQDETDLYLMGIS